MTKNILMPYLELVYMLISICVIWTWIRSKHNKIGKQRIVKIRSTFDYIYPERRYGKGHKRHKGYQSEHLSAVSVTGLRSTPTTKLYTVYRYVMYIGRIWVFLRISTVKRKIARKPTEQQEPEVMQRLQNWIYTYTRYKSQNTKAKKVIT